MLRLNSLGIARLREEAESAGPGRSIKVPAWQIRDLLDRLEKIEQALTAVTKL